MKCRILKTFKGSQDGSRTEEFLAGTERELSAYLVAAVDPAWIEPVEAVAARASPAPAAVTPDNKAIATDGGRAPGRPRRAK